MCGIYGWQWKPGASVPAWKRAVLATVLGINNAKRGSHSWGMLTPGGVKKGMGSIEDVAHIGRRCDWLVAHTRYATHGDKTVENTHPFTQGDITGAHNGIIYNHDELDKLYGRDFDVDSMHIFAHLAEKKPLSELEGYGTVEWVDAKKPGVVHLGKLTASGELAVCETVYGVLWSSDEDHLKQALNAVCVTPTWMKIEAGTLYYAEKGKLWYTQELNIGIQSSKWTDKRTSGNVIGYRGHRSYNSWSDYGNDEWSGHWYDRDDDKKPEVKSSTVATSDAPPSDVVSEEEALGELELMGDYEQLNWADLREMYVWGDYEAGQEMDRRINELRKGR